MIVSEEEYLAHYGVKGMKWGVIRDRVRSSQRAQQNVRTHAGKAAKRAQLAADKSKGWKQTNNASDAYLLDYRSKKVLGRMVKLGTKSAINMALNEGLKRTLRGEKSSNRELAVKAGKIVARTVAHVVIKDKIANQVVARYDKDGKRIDDGTNGGKLTKQQKQIMKVHVAETMIKLGPMLLAPAAIKVGNNARERRYNRDMAAEARLGQLALNSRNLGGDVLEGSWTRVN